MCGIICVLNMKCYRVGVKKGRIEKKEQQKMEHTNYIEKAKKLRSNPMCPNCAETIMMSFADKVGISEEQMAMLGSNFGGGMSYLWRRNEFVDDSGITWDL